VISPHDECTHALEIVLVKLGEAAGVALCGLDHTALWLIFTPVMQCRFFRHLRISPD
jgi:hypothetical protein